MRNIIITIDGPAASGKEKISKYISKKWKLKHLDSGIIYRRLALVLLKDKVNIKNVNQIKKKLKEISNVSFQKSRRIRTQEISNLASKIAVYNFVRIFVNKLQYKFVENNKNTHKKSPASADKTKVSGQDFSTVKYKSIQIVTKGPIELMICQTLFFREGI